MFAELKSIVVAVGEELLTMQKYGYEQGVWEGTQMKAEADLVAHHKLVTRLTALTSHIPIISEENVTSWAIDRLKQHWLIDPIDGTASFVGGYSGYVTQVALMDGCIPVMSAIYAPAQGLLYSAERGKGAFLNNKRLVISPSPMVSLIDNYPSPHGIALSLYTALGFRRYIESGSIALKICKVANGIADVFFKSIEVKDWDLAGAHLVLEEAKGSLTDVDGERIPYTDGYSRCGVIATQTKDVCSAVVKWYRNYVVDHQDEKSVLHCV